MKYYCIKSVFTGEPNVGKSSIIVRYADNFFNTNIESTIGIDFRLKKIQIDNTMISLQLWDTAGQEKYRSLTNSYYKNVYLFFIVFNITERSTFNKIEKLLEIIENESFAHKKYVLIGNQLDNISKRQVSYDEANKFAIENNMDYYEVSAKNNINIDTMFTNVLQDIIDNIDSIQFGNGIVDITMDHEICLTNQVNINESCFKKYFRQNKC